MYRMANIETKIPVIFKTDSKPIYNIHSDINKHIKILLK